MAETSEFDDLEDLDFELYDGLFERIEDTLCQYGGEFAVSSAAELDGFFMGIGCAPDLVLPSDWLPAIWGGAEYNPSWDDEQVANDFIDSVFVMYELTLDQLKHGACPLFIAKPYFEEDVDPIIQEWCRGFIRGIKLWAVASKRLLNIDELLAPIRMFGTTRGEELMDSMGPEEVARWAERIEPNVLRIRDAFEARNSQSMLAPLTPYLTDAPYTDRSKPCPCGSGKKYGKCCLH